MEISPIIHEIPALEAGMRAESESGKGNGGLKAGTGTVENEIG